MRAATSPHAVAATGAGPHRLILIVAGVVFLLFAFTQTAQNSFPVLSTPNRILGMTLVGLSLPLLLRIRGVSFEVRQYLIFVAYAVLVGMLTATNPDAVFRAGLTLVQIGLLMVAVFAYTYTSQSFAFIPFGMFYLAAVNALYTVASGSLASTLASIGSERLASLANNPNGFAVLQVLGVAAALYCIDHVRSVVVRLLCSGSIALFSTCVVLSGSRKAFIGLALLVVCWLLFCNPARLFRNAWTLLLAVTLIGSGLLAYNFIMSETMLGTRLERSIEVGGLGEDRTTLYDQVWVFWQERPVVGIGLDNFRYLSHSGQMSHSDFGELLACTGLIGALLYLVIYLHLIWASVRIWRLYRGHPRVRYNVGFVLTLLVVLFFLGAGLTIYNAPHLIFIPMSASAYYYWLLRTHPANAGPSRMAAMVAARPRPRMPV